MPAMPKPRPRILARHDKRIAKERAQQAMRQEIRRRDSDKCRICHKAVWWEHPNPERRAHVHHLVYRSASKDLQDAPSNLVLLCGLDHARVHAGELVIRGEDASNGLSFDFVKDGVVYKTISELKSND